MSKLWSKFDLCTVLPAPVERYPVQNALPIMCWYDGYFQFIVTIIPFSGYFCCSIIRFFVVFCGYCLSFFDTRGICFTLYNRHLLTSHPNVISFVSSGTTSGKLRTVFISAPNMTLRWRVVYGSELERQGSLNQRNPLWEGLYPVVKK